MVKEARGRQGGVTPIREDVVGESRTGTYDSAPVVKEADSYNFVRKVGGAGYATAGNDEDTMKKLRKLEVLASSDKETIET